MFQDITMTSKFRGKYLSVTPGGHSHVKFKSGGHYTFKKITTTVHNIIVGKLWVSMGSFSPFLYESSPSD